MDHSETRASLLACRPSLFRYAVSLCRSEDLAEDLVQDTLLKAIEHIGDFIPGSNAQAWLFTILRNTYFSLYRKKKREVLTADLQDKDGESWEPESAVPPNQEDAVYLGQVMRALERISESRRDVFLSIQSGDRYEDVGAQFGIPIGTVKSQVFRAKERLLDDLGIESTKRVPRRRRTRTIRPEPRATEQSAAPVTVYSPERLAQFRKEHEACMPKVMPIRLPAPVLPARRTRRSVARRIFVGADISLTTTIFLYQK